MITSMSRKLLSIRTETIAGWYCDSCRFAIPLATATQQYGATIEEGVFEAFEKHDCSDYPTDAQIGYLKPSA